MAEWGEINTKFIDWLKTQDVDFKEDDKEFAPIKYKEQFKLFIEKHDDDEDLNMDSFTKTKKDAEEKKDDTLADEMVKDYIADLDKDDEAFKAIDTDKDGEISNDERNAFMDKVMQACFDDNEDDFSFEDFSTAIEKIKDGDTDFLTANAAQQAPAGNDVGNDVGNDGGNNNPGNVANDGNGAGDGNNQNTTGNNDTATNNIIIPQSVEEAVTLETPKIDYTPNIATKQNLKIKSANIDTSLLSGNYSNSTLPELNTSRNNVVGQIDTSKADFENYKSLHSAASTAQAQAGQYINQNEKQYSLIMNSKFENDENAQLVNQQITAYEATIETTSTTIDTLCQTKDTVSTTLSTTQTQIGSLQGQLYTTEEYTDEETGEVKTRTVKNEAVAAQIAQLQAQENELQTQLAEIAQQLLECQEIMDKTNEELQESYANLESVINTTDLLTSEEKENVQAMLNNKKVYSQATCDMKSAQAGLVATEGYINSLANELATIDAAIEEAEKQAKTENAEEKDQANENPQENTEETQYPNGVINLEYPENRDQIPGLAQMPQGEIKNVETSEDGKTVTGYSLETDDCTINVNYNPKNGQYTYTYDYKDETRLDETVISGANSFTHKVGEDNRYVNKDNITTTTITGIGPNGEKITLETTITKNDNGDIDNLHYEASSVNVDGTKETYITDIANSNSDDGTINSMISTYETIKGSESYKQIIEDSIDENGANIKSTKRLEGEKVVLDNTIISDANGSKEITRTTSSEGNPVEITITKDSEGNILTNTEVITSTDSNGNGEITTIEKDAEGNILSKTETIITDNLDGGKTTNTTTRDADGNVTSNTKTETSISDDGVETSRIVEKDGDGNVLSDTTTVVEEHATGGSQGGAIHTVTTTTDNLTGETTTEEKTVTSNTNGSKETTTITNPDGTKITTTVKKDKDGNVVSNTTTKTETHSSGGSQGGAIHTITTTTDNLTGETTVEERTVSSNANGSKETTTITNPDGTKTTSAVEEKAPKEVPETVRLAHDGFDRKTEVTQDGEIYTTQFGKRLAWIEENDQGEYVEKSWTPVHGEEGKYYFVGEPNGETYTVKDLEGNEYTCEKYPNDKYYNLKKKDN